MRDNIYEAWSRTIKQVIGRFVRGNIPTQLLRILLPSEQKKNHEKARARAEQWKQRGA
jgi:hypothetical protein